jgi:hypothetical protein
MNKNPRYTATITKYTKCPYIKKALLNDKDGTTKPAPKPQKEKVVNSY